jgi:hypothetical protein
MLRCIALMYLDGRVDAIALIGAYVRAAIAALLAAMYELTAWKAVSVVSARAVRIAWPVRTDPLICASNHARAASRT